MPRPPTRRRSAAPVEEPAPAPGVRAADFRSRVAVDAVQHLAGTIGPREATGAAYDRAARWVARALTRSGLVVRAPAGRGACRDLVGRAGGRRPLGQRRGDAARLPRRGSRTWWSGPTSTPSRRRPAPRTTPPGSVCCSGSPRRWPPVVPACRSSWSRSGPRSPAGPRTPTTTTGRGSTSRGSPRPSAPRSAGWSRSTGWGSARSCRSARRTGVPTAVADELERAARRIGVPVVREVNRSSDHWQFAQAGHPRGAAGQHAVRRLPLAPGHPGSGRPGPAGPGRATGAGVAGGCTLRVCSDSSGCSRGSPASPTSARVARPTSPCAGAWSPPGSRTRSDALTPRSVTSWRCPCSSTSAARRTPGRRPRCGATTSPSRGPWCGPTERRPPTWSAPCCRPSPPPRGGPGATSRPR